VPRQRKAKKLGKHGNKEELTSKMLTKKWISLKGTGITI
jgi:hypothetical protein